MKGGILFYIAIIVAIIAVPAFMSKNVRTRTWGGTTNYSIPSGQKLVNATWKDSNLWVLTRPMYPNEEATTYNFVESSTYGQFEGKVIFIESK